MLDLILRRGPDHLIGTAQILLTPFAAHGSKGGIIYIVRSETSCTLKSELIATHAAYSFPTASIRSAQAGGMIYLADRTL
jgi:hypothetical protein